ncbi:MAG: deoxyribodipyrimidine photo-lyase, partial [Actinobacteria bacterium]|nr:deoxyribodipyrimidine photo-lyase [Actinomycetota bacterium]
RQVGAAAVHVSADFGPYGRRRDDAVATALGDIPLVATGSPYAVDPGLVRTGSGGAFRVFTPYYRAWLAHGLPSPAPSVAGRVEWLTGPHTDDVPPDPRAADGLDLPPAGEEAARRRWRAFHADHLSGYADDRDRPDLDRTTHLSPYLKWGCIHPRTLLADLTSHRPGHETLRRELAWREFYADVLHEWPDSAREYWQPDLAALSWGGGDDAGLAAWRDGRTGYPIVDAGMRQLLAEGWVPNRVRMIVASFLVKDLHVDWRHGARHFMRHLVDGDLASNQHGWQWVAGSGTDAAPFFRIFNPTTQARRFDPDGDYVRRWVPELRSVAGGAVHEPWRLDAPPPEYPAPIVDHAVERRVALADYEQARTSPREGPVAAAEPVDAGQKRSVTAVRSG